MCESSARAHAVYSRLAIAEMEAEHPLSDDWRVTDEAFNAELNRRSEDYEHDNQQGK